MKYDPKLVEEINNENVESINDMIADVSVATSESVEVDFRKNIISNIFVPQTSGIRVINV